MGGSEPSFIYFYYYYIFLATPQGMWDPGSPTRYLTMLSSLWKLRVLTTGPIGMSWKRFKFSSNFYMHQHLVWLQNCSAQLDCVCVHESVCTLIF